MFLSYAITTVRIYFFFFIAGTNEFCVSDCVEAPEQCRITQSHIPFDQLPAHEERAVYIPKIYSDPILEILQQSSIPTEA